MEPCSPPNPAPTGSPPRRIAPDDHADLVRRLVAGDPAATAQVIALAPTCDDPALLVAAAVAAGDRGQLERANALRSDGP